jgi:hypothetical protein
VFAVGHSNFVESRSRACCSLRRMAGAAFHRGAGSIRTVCAPLALLALFVTILVPTVAHGEAQIEVRPAADSPVTLVEPRDGSVLEGGGWATLAWRPDHDLAAAGVHEWEAFLSFDGGRTWPARVTPHLDTDLTAFRFSVPAVPSDNVRLMLRFGDEREEVGYVLHHRLRVVLPSLVLPVLSRLSFEAGEPARNGDPGVALWLEGSRDGSQLELRSWTGAPIDLEAAPADRMVFQPLLYPPEKRLDGAAAATASKRVFPHTCGRRLGRGTGSRASLSPCLVSCRQNE